MHETAPDPADAALLRRYVEEKSDAAFRQLVGRYLDLVYSAALRQTGGNAHAAQDIAQEVFTTLARRASSLTQHPVLTGWLYTTTHHVASAARRAEWRRRTREQEAFRMQETLSSDAPVDWDRVRPVLDAAMRELNARDREAVLLRFFAHRAFAEIGTSLNLSEDAARMRVERALDKLHALLARRGLTSTTAALAAALTTQAVTAAPAGLVATVGSAALAGAGALGAGGGIGSWIVFMSTTKVTAGVAGLLTALAIGVAVYETNQAQASTVALTQERDLATKTAASFAARMHAAEAQAKSDAARVASLQEQLAAAKKSSASAATAPATPVAVASPWSQPGFVQLSMDRYRASLSARYGPLYRSLHLSPSQIAKFESLLIEGQQGVFDIWASASAQGLHTDGDTPTATSVARMTSDPLGRMNNGIKALLGEAGAADYDQYEKTCDSRETVNSLAGVMYSTETPLTAQQGDALLAILAANTKQQATPMASDGGDQLHSITQNTDWAAVEKQASGILSAAQLDALKSLNRQKELDQQMTQLASGSPAPAK